MYGQSKQASMIQQAKFFVVPAVVLGAWVLLTGCVLSSLAPPTPLQVSIQKVLSHPAGKPTATLVAAKINPNR